MCFSAELNEIANTTTRRWNYSTTFDANHMERANNKTLQLIDKF